VATKNTRNARLLLCLTLGGTYVVITKTHGLNINIETDFSEDTSHGDRFKSYLSGLQDASFDIERWYDPAQNILEAAALNKLTYYFMAYPDYDDVTNYYRGQMAIGGGGNDLSIGNTANQAYEGRIANSDIQIVRAGVAL
jgi:hypothetical protein